MNTEPVHMCRCGLLFQSFEELAQHLWELGPTPSEFRELHVEKYVISLTPGHRPATRAE